jgi:hypothetical protein
MPTVILKEKLLSKTTRRRHADIERRQKIADKKFRNAQVVYRATNLSLNKERKENQSRCRHKRTKFETGISIGVDCLDCGLHEER